jgi:hypothetical protein
MGQPFLDYAGGVLRMEGVPLAELTQRLGSPFFLISASRLRSNYQALERGLAAAGPETVLRYCAKTNREAAVLEVMGALGERRPRNARAWNVRVRGRSRQLSGDQRHVRPVTVKE